VHGGYAAATLPPEDKAQLEADGTLFRVWRTGRLKLDGLPDGYQTAYHTQAHVERAWATPAWRYERTCRPPSTATRTRWS